MVLRIESMSDGQRVVLRLSGRLQSEHVDQLKAQVEEQDAERDIGSGWR